MRVRTLDAECVLVPVVVKERLVEGVAEPETDNVFEATTESVAADDSDERAEIVCTSDSELWSVALELPESEGDFEGEVDAEDEREGEPDAETVWLTVLEAVLLEVLEGDTVVVRDVGIVRDMRGEKDLFAEALVVIVDEREMMAVRVTEPVVVTDGELSDEVDADTPTEPESRTLSVVDFEGRSDADIVTVSVDETLALPDTDSDTPGEDESEADTLGDGVVDGEGVGVKVALLRVDFVYVAEDRAEDDKPDETVNLTEPVPKGDRVKRVEALEMTLAVTKDEVL